MEEKSLVDILTEQQDKNTDINLGYNPDSVVDYKKQQEISEVVRYRQDTENRNKLTCWVKWVVSVYLSIVFIILCINSHLIFLSDSIICTLLGTTTLNVLGLMYIVLKGYFNK